jgi:predicted dehydrogenase/threonine dehydrogenase-like Zn-dependent dehydrogenase
MITRRSLPYPNMKAILQDPRSGRLDVCDVPSPELRSGGVLVQTLFSAISAGTEQSKLETAEKSLLGKAFARPDQLRLVLKVAQGEGIGAAYQKVKSRLDSLSPLGYSSAGIVLAVGDGVGDLRPGDRVACGGAGYANHAEVNFVPRNLVASVPASVAMEDASLTTIGAIAMQGLRQADLHLGESVAVIGAGLVGLLTIQLAKASGCRVLALDVDPARVDFATGFGAHLALLSNDSQTLAAVRHFSPFGVDAAVITAASPSAEPLELAASILRDRGRAIVVGDIGMGVERRNLYDKELSVALSRSYGPGRYDVNYEEKGVDYPIGYVRWTERRNMEAFLDLLARGSVEVGALTSQQCTIEDAPSAYALIRERKVYTVILRYSAAQVDPPVNESRAAASHVTNGRRATGGVNISCVGAGGFARSVIFPRLARIRGAKLFGVASSSGHSAESAFRSAGFEKTSTVSDIFDDSEADVVFILSRHDTHGRYVVRGLAAGKAVFCEKPLAVNRRELASITDEYDRQVLTGSAPFLMVGFNRRFAPLTAKMVEFFAERVEPMMIHIRINAGQLTREHWAHEAGGRVVGELCHFVDFARTIVNSPVETAWARALLDSPVYNRDNLVANLSFEDGSMANIVYVANGDKVVPKEFFEVFCGGSTARLDDFRVLELVRNGRTRKFKCKRDKGHQRELELTVEAITKNDPAPIPFKELVEVTEATFRIAEAIGIPLERVVEPESIVQPA